MLISKFIEKFKILKYIGKSKYAENIDLKRRFVECLEKSQLTSKQQEEEDEDHFYFFSKIVTKQLKLLDVLPKLEVQQQILKLIADAIKKQNEK